MRMRASVRVATPESRSASALDSDLAYLPPPQALFDAARQFGLTEEETWRTVDENCPPSSAESPRASVWISA